MSSTFFTIALLTGIAVVVVGVVGSVAQEIGKRRQTPMTREDMDEMATKLNEQVKEKYRQWSEDCAKAE